MAITNYEQGRDVGQLRTFRDEIDRVFENFMNPVSLGRLTFMGEPQVGELAQLKGGFLPKVDLRETAEGYVLTAEMPGMKKEDIDINVTENAVTLRGERKEEREEKKGSYYLKETSSGSFRRVVALPGTCDVDKVSAVMNDGVLQLTLPKVEKSKGRDIKIA